MNLILTDIKEIREQLLPLTFTRPTAMLPCGIGTIAGRWPQLLPGAEVSFQTEPYLQELFPLKEAVDSIWIAGHVIPDSELATHVAGLLPGEWIADSTGQWIARRGEAEGPAKLTMQVKAYRQLPNIFQLSKDLITADFDFVTDGRKSEPLPETSTLIGPADRLFIEKGATVEGVTINTKMGPVYIGARADVQECVVLRGPIAIGADCRVRAGARLLPGVNLLPDNRVGGEISNTVFLGHSNKQHDGFLGDAVVGQWCNLGAGCTASNLKNDYSLIRLWSYPEQKFARTPWQFCGLIMADHCKAAIGTMFNTATIVGPGCNIHGAGFPRTYIPAFSEGGAQGFKRANLKKFMATATEMMSHRGITLTDADARMLQYLFDHA